MGAFNDRPGDFCDNCRNCKYSTEIKMQDEAMYTFKIDLFVNWGSGDNVFSVLHKD